MFVGLKHKISIIMTFSQELFSEEDKQNVIAQFHDVEELKRVYATIEGRIFYLGAAQKKTVYGKETMQRVRQNVHRQRNELLSHIHGQDTTYNVKQLKVYKDNLLFLKRIGTELPRCCSECAFDLHKFQQFVKHYDAVTSATEDDAAANTKRHTEL